MAKCPLLRGKLEKPAVALLLSFLLPIGFSETRAFAEGESTQQGAPAPAGAAALPEKNAEETARESAGESKAGSGITAPAGAKSEAKPGETAAAAAPAVPPAEAKSEAKPAAKPGETAAAAESAAPAQAKAEAKPAAQPNETAAAAALAIPAEAKAEAKPADAKPAGAASSSKPADAKEATAAKPKALTPKPDSDESLAVRASTVNAVYGIHFLGAHIGEFKIRSSITNRRYTLQANADVSVFFGAVSWQGVTNSSGLMTANGPVPQNYSFRYATNDRREAVEIRFQQRMVSDIIINPPAHPGARSVPITAADLQNVVDPLSAVVLLSQARLSRHSGDACNKRLPIFDGKIRYDLVLSPKGTRTIGSSGKLHGTAYVCRVNYIPIAGHKPGRQSGNDYATGNTGIEIWLVPVPEAGLLVPYYVHVPTPAGTASMVTAKFDVETPSGRHALAD
ncbi:MAG: DUF3108 domain-containing protein [Rhodomicrobium sp.]